MNNELPRAPKINRTSPTPVKKQKLPIIPLIIIIILMINVSLFSIYSRTKKKVPENPETLVGNSAGNLYNGGYFCEDGETVFFRNPLDKNSLYRMDIYGENIEKMVDVPIAYINNGGDFLYFYYDDNNEEKFMGIAGSMSGIYRYAKNGKSAVTSLDRCVSGCTVLSGNQIYYQHYDNKEGMSIYSVSTEGKDAHQVIDAIINPSCIINTEMYFADEAGGYYLNIYNPTQNTVARFLDMRTYWPIISANYLFFINVDDNYRLYRYDLSSGSLAKLTDDRVDCYNVYGDMIFYQKNSKKEPALMRMHADGSSPEAIAMGNYTNINCTRTYTYYTECGTDFPIYRVPTSSSATASIFNPPLAPADDSAK